MDTIFLHEIIVILYNYLKNAPTFEGLINERMNRLVLLLFFFFQGLVPVNAYLFRNYQVEDGLSHNSVWAVMQDKRGFMWFGTADGLSRFDGRSFKIYKRRQGDPFSIGSNFIHYLKEDSRGRFLVGTKQGLYLFDRTHEQFRRISLNKNKEDDVSINYIMEDPDGDIWLACHGQGLYVLSPDLKIKKHYQHNSKNSRSDNIPSNFIWTLVQDFNGGIWLGSDGQGLIRFDPKGERFTKIKDEKESGVTDPTVYSLYCDIDNDIWVGTSSSGLCRYNYRTGKTSCYMNQKVFNIKAITEFSDNNLIMGSDKGLVKFDRHTNSFYLINNNTSFDNLTDKSIFSIAKDTEGSFWIGTYFGGVNYYSPAVNRVLYYYDSSDISSEKNIVSSFAEDAKGKIWIGSHNNGLFLFNPGNSKLERVKYNIGYHNIQKLLFDGDKLYISLYGKGVEVLNTTDGTVSAFAGYNSGTVRLGSNSVSAIFKTSKGKVLLGTEEGGNEVSIHQTGLKPIGYLAGMPIKDIEEDYRGNIWFAAHMHGLLRLSADGKWKSFAHQPNDPTSLVSNNVNCVYQDSKYRLWVGTEGEGLAMYDLRTGRFDLVLNEESGLPSNIIYSIVDDSAGNIWVSTGGGLLKIDLATLKVKTFGYMGDKIRYNLNCSLRASDNRLYFGGTNGFIVFNPSEITDNLIKPHIVITGFQLSSNEVLPGARSLLNVSISDTKEITLENDQSNFSFDFAALSYLSPAQNRYAYMLEGFDKEWNYINSNKAVYMNIPPGKYVFRVKGSNNDGIWSPETRIVIRVKPWFWSSNTMIAMYVILAVAICTYIFKLYNKRIEIQNQEKLYKFKTTKEKEIYESKINFFTNIAHEIRTPLSLIAAPLETILSSGDGNQNTKSNLEIIGRNANRLLKLVNQLLDFRKIEEDMFHFNFRRQNIIEIVHGVFKQYYENARFKGIEMTLITEKDDLQCTVDSEAIYKIVSNLISNAVKYAKSEIKVIVELINNDLLVSVKDDGPGVEESYLERVFEPFFQIRTNNNTLNTGSGLGLSLSQSLAKKHGGIISVESELDRGCIFTLKIPIINNQDILQEDSTADLNGHAFNNLTSTESKPKILIVEDNEELCAFLNNCLCGHFFVFEAQNGVQALNVVDKESIDIIISDILMPEMDGLELCNILKSDLAHSHIPIVLLSAKTDTTTKVEGLNKGADVYIEKPFSVEQLKAQINSIIENRNRIRNNFLQSPLQYYKQDPGNSENAGFVEKLNNIILEYLSDENFSIDQLSEKFSMSRSNFHKKIKNITGITPNDYIKLIRLNQSARLLSTGRYKINEVCYLVGFNTPSYFSKCFYDQFGKLPKDFAHPDPGLK